MRMLLACFACCLGAAGAAEVTMAADGPNRTVTTPAYTAVVGEDGCLISLKVGGTELFATKARGAYFWQAKSSIQRLTKIEAGGDTITASGDTAKVVYTFGDTLRCDLTNLTAAPMEYVIVFDAALSAVRDEDGKYRKVPLTKAWAAETWFRDHAKLRIEGGTRVWGPYGAERQQVWQLSIPPQERRTVTLLPAAATDEEAKAAAAEAARMIAPPTDPTGPMWDLGKLGATPKSWPAEGFTGEGVRAVWYEGVPYEGRPTRVFAWVGLPKLELGKKVPGIVLVHGGGGTAFDSWVRLWTSRGYAAISMDTCGCVPKGTYGHWEHDPQGGPPGWGGLDQIDEPREDQWTYHAVADAILGHSLLRSLPEVDPERIGVTGISWGGYLCSILAGADPRFKFAVPVYGCGHYDETVFAAGVSNLGKERAERWYRWWDPQHYLKQAKVPMLWVTGTNDHFFWFPALQKSYRDTQGPHTLAIRVRMGHGHGPVGEGPEEIHAFADSLVNGGAPLAQVTGQGRDGQTVWATFKAASPMTRAELTFTRDRGPWEPRKWETLPATLADGKATATLPEGVTVYYLNLLDGQGRVVSSEHVEVK